jgi:hypothetical protein
MEVFKGLLQKLPFRQDMGKGNLGILHHSRLDQKHHSRYIRANFEDTGIPNKLNIPQALTCWALKQPTTSAESKSLLRMECFAKLQEQEPTLFQKVSQSLFNTLASFRPAFKVCSRTGFCGSFGRRLPP